MRHNELANSTTASKKHAKNLTPMKHLFTMIFAIAAITLVMPFTGTSQQTYVPDDNFEQRLIDLGLDSGPLDNYVPTANIDTVTSLYVEEKEISDMTGIEDFVSLKKLDCYDNSITTLDMSSCTALEDLDCYRNGLTSLNLSNCSSLVYLRCYDNLLTSLNVDDCTSLEFLNCKINSLTSIDVSNCTVLEELVCIENSLTSINTNGLTALKYIHCYENAITSLDVSTNNALYNLDCHNNAMTTLNASGCVDLEWLFCSDNSLTSINLSNCTSLEWLVCSDNSLTSINLSDNIAILSLDCSNNMLTSLDISLNTGLLQLICYDNTLTSLNLKNGNNANMQGDEDYAGLDARANPNLLCIQVDDSDASSGYQFWYKDDMASYSEDCGPTTVSTHFSNTDIKLFPNPASSVISLESSIYNQQAVLVAIFDLNGRKLLEKNFLAEKEVVEVDLSNLEAGMYLCRISFDNRSATKKIIKE